MLLAKIWSGINDGSFSMLLRTVLEAENDTNAKSMMHNYDSANAKKHTHTEKKNTDRKKRSNCCSEWTARKPVLKRKYRDKSQLGHSVIHHAAVSAVFLH